MVTGCAHVPADPVTKRKVHMTAWEQIKALLASRKFWAMVTAIVAAAAALATNQIDMWQFIIAVVTATAAFSTGVAIEDAGVKIGAGLRSDPPAATPETTGDQHG
jgi:hypothetical protein